MWAIPRKVVMNPSYSKLLARAAIAVAASVVFDAAAAPTLAPIPAAPAYGQAVQLQLRDSLGPVYLPATRYSRNANMLTIEFEYMNGALAAPRPDFDVVPLDFGELAPGNYLVEARFIDMARPSAPPQVVSSGIAVAAPTEWGVFTVPQRPNAFEPVQILVTSAAYFDPASLHAIVMGGTVRVDFDYYQYAPVVWNNPPPGAVAFASVTVGGLPPGGFRVEAWAKPKDGNGGPSALYFTRDVTVAQAATAVEFYSPQKDHYFVTAGPEEIARLDSGAEPGWQRTGQRFKVWLRQEDAPAGAVPVCRFYASGPSSHFYTLNASECDWLKRFEQSQRALTQAAGLPYLGWSYEGVAFYSVAPQNGQCGAGMSAVYRAFNGSSTLPNHRFTADARQRAAMLVDWNDEGVAFCSPG